MPVLTDLRTGRATVLLITNVAVDALRVRLHLLNGADWSSVDFACEVGSSETVPFSFEPSDSGLEASFTCAGVAASHALEMREGIAFFTAERLLTGATTNGNLLLGEAHVFGRRAGTALSLDAIVFQGPDVNAPGAGDRTYRFDGIEYSHAPGALATAFFAPSRRGRIGIGTELILFTLDGTPGLPPQARTSLTSFDSAGEAVSASHAFSGFDVVALDEIDSRFSSERLGKTTGHLLLTPEVTEQLDGQHDALHDGGIGSDGVRKIPIFGWIVHSGRRALVDGKRVRGRTSWGRALDWSFTPLVPTVGDIVTFAAE